MAKTKKRLKKAKGDQVVLHVPPGSRKDVTIQESPPESRGQDITLQVSRTRKAKLTKAVGVIVK